jgi:hypothetical protein
MEMSPARQKLLFVAIVAALAVIGYYLVLPGLKHHTPAAAAATTPSSSPSQSPAPVYSAAPVVTQSPSGPVNIYDWLPFTQANLAAAAEVTTQFCVDYETYTYTESPADYIGKMSPLTTTGMAGTLQAGYIAPGVASLRKEKKQISSGSATISTLRAFGQTSMTFVVAVTQHLVSGGAATSATTQFAVTLIGSGNSWQVNDIELASQGNT